VTTKYTFKQEYPGFVGFSDSAPPSTITMEINGELSLTQVLERFEEFLRGAGFHFDGHLDFVDDDSNNLPPNYADYEVNVDVDPNTGLDNTFFFNTDNMGSTTSITMPEEHSTYYYDYSRNK
jgi:hypothetical protein